MDNSAHLSPNLRSGPADLFQDWIDYGNHDNDFSPINENGELSTTDSSSSTMTSPLCQDTTTDGSPSYNFTECLDMVPSSPQPSKSPSDAVEGKKLSDRRREQNRASQRAYRDRQKMLVDGLTAKLREVGAQLEQQKTKCEALETTCKHLATENDVYRTFLKLEKRPQ